MLHGRRELAMATTARDDVIEHLEGLSDESLEAVLAVLRQIRRDEFAKRWSRVFGSLPDEDAEQMRRAIEEGCENVDPDAW
jgi:hypothetical protein